MASSSAGSGPATHDIVTFRLKHDFRPGDVEWEQMIAAGCPRDRMKAVPYGTMGYVSKSKNKDRKWVLVQLFDPRRPFANPTEQVQPGVFLPFSLLVLGRGARKFVVDDPYAAIQLSEGSVGAPNVAGLPARVSRILTSPLAKLLAMFMSPITEPSNKQEMLDLGVPEELLDPISGNPWLVLKPMLRGMDELGTLDCFRVRMENGDDHWRMPTFEDLWELDDVDQLLARLPDDHEITRSTVFYIVLYRNVEDGKGLYAGRTIRVLVRAQEHVRNVNNTSNHSRHYQLARRIMRHDGEMRFIPITFIHPNEGLLSTIEPWIEQLLIMLFESYNGALFADWTQPNTMEDIISRNWSKELATEAHRDRKNGQKPPGFRGWDISLEPRPAGSGLQLGQSAP